MSPEQVAHLGKLFSAAYPFAPWTAETTAVWAAQLSDLSPAYARDVADLWIRTEARPPTIAQYLERRREYLLAEQQARPLGALPEYADTPPPDPRDLAVKVAGMKRRLAEAVDRIGAAKRLTHEEVRAAEDEARQRAVAARGGPLEPCPYCADDPTRCLHERLRELAELKSIKQAAASNVRNRKRATEEGHTLGPDAA